MKRRVFAVRFAPGALAAAALAVSAVLASTLSVASAQTPPPASGILLSVEPAAVSEASGTTSVTVTALVGTTETLASPTDVTVSVTGGSSGGQATSGTDFNAVADFTINLAAGDTSATGSFNLVVSDDTASEGPETITVSGTGASLPVTPGTLTINDDDKPPPMNATGCTNGTHVTNPTSNAGLVADCQNLVATRNHWTNHPDNVNLAHNHTLRTWTANITTWTGIDIQPLSNRVWTLALEASASADASQRIGGTIPAQLGNLTNLSQLRLSNNRLSGEIPAQLGNLTNLSQLWLHNNRLTGEIPAQLGNLTNFSQLVLSNNRLSGEIPAQLGNLANLQYLYLDGNRLTGEIPAQLGNLANLQYLYLNGNRLTGEIPAEFGDLTALTSFRFCGNYLTGALPAALRSGVTLDFTPGDYDMIGTCRRPALVGLFLFPPPPPPPPDAFDDDGSGHETAVNALAQAGITRGCAPKRFCPDQPATRAQTAAMIYRSVARQTGVGAPYAGRVALTDVPADAAWWNAAQWAASTGVIPATPNGEFNPAGAVTRAQTAAMLTTAFEHLGLTKINLTAQPQHIFTDTQDHPDATVNAIEALYERRITLGCAADPPRYCPDQPTTRAQLATMLARTIRLTPTPETP